MATTIGAQLTLDAGTSADMTIELQAKGVLLNDGGDDLTEVSNGYFTAEIAEPLVASYDAIIKKDGADRFVGSLPLGQTEVQTKVVGVPALAALAAEIEKIPRKGVGGMRHQRVDDPTNFMDVEITDTN